MAAVAQRLDEMTFDEDALQPRGGFGVLHRKMMESMSRPTETQVSKHLKD